MLLQHLPYFVSLPFTCSPLMQLLLLPADAAFSYEAFSEACRSCSCCCCVVVIWSSPHQSVWNKCLSIRCKSLRCVDEVGRIACATHALSLPLTPPTKSSSTNNLRDVSSSIESHITALLHYDSCLNLDE